MYGKWRAPGEAKLASRNGSVAPTILGEAADLVDLQFNINTASSMRQTKKKRQKQHQSEVSITNKEDNIPEKYLPSPPF